MRVDEPMLSTRDDLLAVGIASTPPAQPRLLQPPAAPEERSQ